MAIVRKMKIKTKIEVMLLEVSDVVLDQMLSYGISNPFQPDFGLPPISQHNLRFNGYN